MNPERAGPAARAAAAATTGAPAAYGRLIRRRAWLVAAAACALLVSLTADVMIGPMQLSPGEVLSALFHPGSADGPVRVTVWTLRLPPAIMAVLIGVALGVAGTVMQTILNNPLASPFTLGISAASGFGAALAIVCGAGSAALSTASLVSASAFVFAMLAALAIYGVARLRHGGGTAVLVLAGVALHFLFSAGVALLQFVARNEDQLRAIVFWLFGNLHGATWPQLGIIAGVALAALPLIAMHAWRLTALRLGEGRARALGVDVARLRLGMLALVSLLTATAICFAGVIGFIGLVAPHLARMALGEDQRFQLPGSALAGALLLSAASVASKLVVPGPVFPIGIATAFIGVPFFAAMILGKKRRHW